MRFLEKYVNRAFLRKYADKVETIKAEKGENQKKEVDDELLNGKLHSPLVRTWLPQGGSGVCNVPDGTYHYCEVGGEILRNDDEEEEHADAHIMSFVPVEYIEGGIPIVMGVSQGGVDEFAIQKAITPEEDF